MKVSNERMAKADDDLKALEEKAEEILKVSRVPNETEALPELLRGPLAIVDDLLDPTGTKSSAGSDSTDLKLMEAAYSTAESNEFAGMVRFFVFHPHSSTKQALMSGNIGPASANHGGFLQTYPNPLTRFAGGSVSTGGESQTTPGSSGTGMDSVTSSASLSALARQAKKPDGKTRSKFVIACTL
ncbi:hypothetical protein M378DRAFT_176058 [Amanita muscaria Koide BX008]|uniref:Uncharacterized protein n=1 Tax=Amanita muscaria (strain Koide BX008) TaxID=946122 RepID=A0A0C2XHW6_AMAMK|nr:hypothetical protein M378DRAFT_176058 [Amanita muscaria Koide BX008]